MNPAQDSIDHRGDLIGKSIWQHHFRQTPIDIELFIDGVVQPRMSTEYFFRDEHQMNAVETEALRNCSGRVLDVGAGAGCHSMALQNSGIEVVALERSSSACEVMIDRGVKIVIHSDVMGFNAAPFDTILLLMNGFGIGGDEEGVVRLLTQLKTLLAPGGRILGDSTDIRYFKDQNDEGEMAYKQFSEVEFEVRVLSKSEFFPWIYPDEVLLEILAEEAGLQYRTVMYDGDFHFLSEMFV
jgi:SAM-dependent methyltransferase